ncbi:extensin family protein [Pseudomonas sp. NPDC087615]|uniref:extensin-like domain-containing protein n=1 Tax=Pseudomonas sp. NPDC087615 TaxID=3364443 RepID=UPI0037F1A758
MVSVWRGWLPVPPEWNPWVPLDVKAAPNWLTGYKLMRLRGDPGLCAQALASSALRVTTQADSPDAKCPLIGALRVQGAEVALSSSFLASCPLAVAYAMFERHTLQPAAQAVYGENVARLDHLGSFACRHLYNRESGALSRHASADALDIAGFRLASGRRVSVLKDWPKQNQDAQFLRQVRDGACQAFSVVLSPDYNAAHRNHFHVDIGRWSVCR